MDDNDLWDECPDAKVFCERVMADIDTYRLHEGEQFSRLAAGIFATDQVDSQNEQMSVSALSSLVQQSRERTIWHGVEHDPTQPFVGRIVALEVFVAPGSGTTFIAGVSALYDPASVASFASLGIALLPPEGHEMETVVPDHALANEWVVDVSPHEVDIQHVTRELAAAPDVIARAPHRAFRKSADPLTIIGLTVPTLALLVWNPFTKAFGETLGKAAAERVVAGLGWARARLLGLVGNSSKRVLFRISAEDYGVEVEFYIEASDHAAVSSAIDRLHEGAAAAKFVAQQLAPFEPMRLVYLFDSASSTWAPVQAVTRKRGIITDRPALLAIEKMGLSLSGRSSSIGS